MEDNNSRNRKAMRLQNYDYSQNGAYFITACTYEKKPILGRITVGDGVLDVPKMHLSEYGRIVEKYILSINQKYNNIFIENHIVMPNHIHMIVIINDLFQKNKENKIGTASSTFPANAIIPTVISTLKRFVNKDIGKNIWQRSYYDHIIRTEEEYKRIWEYIEYNTVKWKSDCYYFEE